MIHIIMLKYIINKYIKAKQLTLFLFFAFHLIPGKQLSLFKYFFLNQHILQPHVSTLMEPIARERSYHLIFCYDFCDHFFHIYDHHYSTTTSLLREWQQRYHLSSHFEYVHIIIIHLSKTYQQRYILHKWASLIA